MKKDGLYLLLKMPRFFKRLLVMGLDSSLIFVSLWLSLFIRLEGLYTINDSLFLTLGLISSCLYVFINVMFGLYRIIFRYSGLLTVISHIKAWGFYFFFFATYLILNPLQDIPRSIGVLQPILLIILVISSRIIARSLLLRSSGLDNVSNKDQRVLIYGGGSAGRQLAQTLHSEPTVHCYGLIDDDRTLQNNIINGYAVYSIEKIPDLIEKYQITDIFMAMPTISRFKKNEIIQKLSSFPVKVRTIPGMTELASGKVSINDIRDLDLDDILGREPVPPNQLLLNRAVRDKTVLVTGAGGSIGSELCRQVLSCQPRKLILVENSEFNLYNIEKELQEVSNKIPLISVLINTCETKKIEHIFTLHRPDTVFHAAAYKHVPLVEQNPAAGLANNVLGTLAVLKAALKLEVGRFILISTDKAVRPTNVMGASKRMAELLVQGYSASQSQTICSMVRFGNVLGSSGSVVPLFRSQVKRGGPITVTHPEVTRYFMSIQEAAQLVIQAGAMAKGGEVFLLDMGQPVKIFDLATQLILLSGLSVKNKENPNGDIEIAITGLRPGEKLYEELLIDSKALSTTHPLIMRATEKALTLSEIMEMVKSVEEVYDKDFQTVEEQKKHLHNLLTSYVEGYIPEERLGVS